VCVYVRLCVCACVRVYESICVFVGMCVSGICVAVSVLPVFFLFPCLSRSGSVSVCVLAGMHVHEEGECVSMCVSGCWKMRESGWEQKYTHMCTHTDIFHKTRLLCGKSRKHFLPAAIEPKYANILYI